MSVEAYMKRLLSFPGAELSFPFGPEAHVFKVKNKMFALLMERDGKWCANLKGLPDDNRALVESFAWAQPGYHMNKRHWVTVTLSEMPENIWEALSAESYGLVVDKLTKAQRQSLADESHASN